MLVQMNLKPVYIIRLKVLVLLNYRENYGAQNVMKCLRIIQNDLDICNLSSENYMYT